MLGHTYCGAIKAACDTTVTEGNLGRLLDKIRPAIASENTVRKNRDAGNQVFLDKVTKINVDNTVRAIYKKSDILGRLIHSGSVGLIGTLYDVRTGEVHFEDLQ